MNGLHGDYLMFFFRCVLLLSSIIPISLRVNLDLAKLYYSYMINTDDKIPDSLARNSAIPEDLGRLQYLITDKTGTLTQNEMLLKKVSTEANIFEADDQDKAFEMMLQENCAKFPEGPCNGPGGKEESKVESQADSSKVQGRRKKNRDQGNNIRDLVTAFALCNNVTPVPDEPDLMSKLDKK
jgi:phospholipid-translocating ATPase